LSNEACISPLLGLLFIASTMILPDRAMVAIVCMSKSECLNFGFNLAVACQVLSEVFPQCFAHLISRRLYGLEAEATGKPAIKERARECTNACACV